MSAAAAEAAIVDDPVVIVIDDDPAVRKSLKFSLEIEGFKVRTYADGGELLKESELPSLGCLIIDYNLPRQNGLDLLRELRRRRVALPAIVITSHPSRMLLERAAADGIPIVEKPLFNQTLSNSIHEVLGR